LYFGQVLFIPLALAILVAFLLAPMAIRLRHYGLGRVTSAVTVVLLAFTLVLIVAAALTYQLAGLAGNLPGYQQNVQKKLEAIRSSGGGAVNWLSQAARTVTEQLTPSTAPARIPNEEKPVPVEIRSSAFSPLEAAQKVAGSVLELLLTSGIVIVFVIFILIQREDLRDRLIRLIGENRINITTQLFDDAARRVSRYLIAQLIINLGFGVLAGLGLYLIGVPDPLLWGILAALLRYIPYLGVWVAAILPAAVAFAVEPGWVKIPLVFALYAGIDLLVYNFAEPLLYGSSTGISPMAILVAAVFWTWLWGPVGLLLSTPLTVCVVVLGRYVPSLQFLSVMLSDEEVLSPHMKYYQRLLAKDLDEATAVVEEFLKGKPLEDLYDQVIIPALTLAEEERHRGRLDDALFLLQSTRLLIEDLGERPELISGPALNRAEALAQKKTVVATYSVPTDNGCVSVMCIPARDEADELAALMLEQLLKRRGLSARALSTGVLVGEHLDELGRGGCKIACVASVPPFGYMHARYLCRRVHAHLQTVKVIATIFTERDVEELKGRQPPLAADEIATSLRNTVNIVLSLVTVETEPAPEPVLAPA
jgi:predicted PurR-regulated permease PerM